MSKRLLFAGLAVLVVILGLLLFASGGRHGYRSDAMVTAKPFTNVFFARSFEAEVVRTIPGVLGLKITLAFSAVPSWSIPVVTNGVGIRIIAVGATPQDAKRVANDAAMQLCRSVLTNYAVKAELVDRATAARRYSYFHDSFQPGIARLFR